VFAFVVGVPAVVVVVVVVVAVVVGLDALAEAVVAMRESFARIRYIELMYRVE